ncbi:MAG: hypothetical protein WCP73_08275, partial [Eubacteriales bacterium]
YSMTFGVSVITVVLPAWYLSMPQEKRKSRSTRARLAFEIGITKLALGFGFEDMQFAWAGEESANICGKRITQIAKEWKTSELDAYIRVVEMSGGKGRVNMYRYYNDEIIAKLMQHGPSLFMTDAWIEENGIQNASAFGCYPKFLQLSREDKIIPLEKAVHKMSGAVASRFGIPKRGVLLKGNAADITVFDPAIVASRGDLPERPEGICDVYINGRHVVKNGLANNLLAGAGKIITRQ